MKGIDSDPGVCIRSCMSAFFLRLDRGDRGRGRPRKTFLVNRVRGRSGRRCVCVCNTVGVGRLGGRNNRCLVDSGA